MARRGRKFGRSAAHGSTDTLKQFAQSQGANNYGLQAKREMHPGDTGSPDIVDAFAKGRRRAVAGFASPVKAMFERRKRQSRVRGVVNQHPQRPQASFRQYDFPALAPIPQQGK